MHTLLKMLHKNVLFFADSSKDFLLLKKIKIRWLSKQSHLTHFCWSEWNPSHFLLFKIYSWHRAFMSRAASYLSSPLLKQIQNKKKNKNSNAALQIKRKNGWTIAEEIANHIKEPEMCFVQLVEIKIKLKTKDFASKCHVCIDFGKQASLSVHKAST